MKDIFQKMREEREQEEREFARLIQESRLSRYQLCKVSDRRFRIIEAGSGSLSGNDRFPISEFRFCSETLSWSEAIVRLRECRQAERKERETST